MCESVNDGKRIRLILTTKTFECNASQWNVHGNLIHFAYFEVDLWVFLNIESTVQQNEYAHVMYESFVYMRLSCSNSCE